MGSKSDSEEQNTMHTDYSPPRTLDIASASTLAALAVPEECADQRLESGDLPAFASGGKKQGSKRRIISLNDDCDDSDVEITPQTQTNQPRRQSSFGIATKKSVLQSTIDGGISSSSQARRKGKFVPLKSVIRGGIRKPVPQSQICKASASQSQKKKARSTHPQKENTSEEIPELGDELDEEEMNEDELDAIGEEEREERQRSDVWPDFTVVHKPNGTMKAKCNHCKNEYASQLNLTDDLLCGGEFFHVRCAAHILNLIVQDGLKVIGGELHKVRESVKYVLGSETRETLFQRCVDATGVVEDGWLILDVSKRWNLTYFMLERAIKYRKAFVQLETFDKKNYKVAPTAEEWNRAAKICEFLGHFAEITTLMSGSNYSTANLYFYQVFLIHEWLQKNEDSEDDAIRYMVPPMKEKFDKYWDEVSSLFAMAAIFDPRFKLTIVEHCLVKLDMSTRDEKMKNLRDKLNNLFQTYNKKSKNNSPSIEPRESVPQKASKAGSNRLFGNYGDFFAFRKVSGIVSGKTPLEAYLDEEPLDVNNFESMDILDWWKDNAHRYGDLAAMACDLLSVPVTTVASESSFSIGSRVLNKYRSRLLPKNVQALICTRNWIKGYESYAHDEEIAGDGDGDGDGDGEGDGEQEKLPSFDSIVNGEDEDDDQL